MQIIVSIIYILPKKFTVYNFWFTGYTGRGLKREAEKKIYMFTNEIT